jgi:acyl carrier protein
MTTSERLTKILVQHYKIDPARLTPDQPLGSLGIDSLGLVEMLFFIEDEFGVRLPSEGMAFGTLGEAARYVDDLLASPPRTQKQVQTACGAATAQGAAPDRRA